MTTDDLKGLMEQMETESRRMAALCVSVDLKSHWLGKASAYRHVRSLLDSDG